MTDHDADLDGGEAYQLTETGARVARQLPMSTVAGHDALLEALLGAGRPDTPNG